MLVIEARKNIEKGISSGTQYFNNVAYSNVGHAIFTEEENNKLGQYIKHASKIYFGITPKEARKLAYECAIAYNKIIPESWTTNKCPGEDWLSVFLKKNPGLSIRTPEATSLARAISFNKHNVQDFFNKLASLQETHNFGPFRIWNLDETGVTTVQKLTKIIAEKGVKQVGGITSSERGVLVTVCAGVSAIGNSVPPMFIFPRKRYCESFVRDGPTGSIGSGNSSGWQTSETFYLFMEHFIEQTRPSIENAILLLLDNHESHLAVNTIDLAKSNGIIILSFPPHCSHKLQPLDRSVYGPFKKYLSVAQNNWHRNNPGKSMSIYNIPSIVADALPKALTPNNITNGFKVSGIYPFNSDVFPENEFLPTSVTDQPRIQEIEQQPCKMSGLHSISPIGELVEEGRWTRPTETEIETTTFPCNEEPADIFQQAMEQPIIFDFVWSEGMTSTASDSNIIGNTRLVTDMSKSTEIERAKILETANPNFQDVISLEQGPSSNRSPEFDLDQPGQFESPQFNIKDSRHTDFSPELIRPFPKAPERKSSKTNRKKRKSAILTSTPEKAALEEEQNKRKIKKDKERQSLMQRNVLIKKTKRSRPNMEQERNYHEKEWLCFVCSDAYTESKVGENWVKCQKCIKICESCT